MDWKPKESIPKDHSVLVLLSDGQMVVMRWEENIENWTTQGWENCHYCGGQSQAHTQPAKYQSKQITHWRPLPEIPDDIGET